MVTVRSTNPGGTLARGGCIRFSAGPGAEGECGDLVYVHGLPGTRVLNKTYAPMLVYNGATAYPHPVVRANVTVPATATTPSSVTAALFVDGSLATSNTWSGSAFAPGQAKRIALGYDAANVGQGLHPYTLQVTSYYGSTGYQTTITDTLAVVNRIYSPFGSGWWLNGLESITSYGNLMLWIGGDGSTRVYRPTGTGWGPWTAEYSNGVDSLVYVATPTDGSAAYYARKLRGGGEVRYAPSTGQQIATVNRLGFVTTFTWETNAYNGFGVRLTGISLPVKTGDFNTGLAYTFGYAAANVPLSSVTAPPLPGQPRVVQLRSGNGWDVTAITDEDGSKDSLFYDGGLPHRISGIRDARGTWTTYTYAASDKLSQVRRYAGGGTSTADDPVTTYNAPENQGYMGAFAPDTAYAYATIDGPRQDVQDNTYIWVNRWGAPAVVEDALANRTWLYREDGRFPETVTEVNAPGGGSVAGVYGVRTIRVAYLNGRGNPDSTIVFNPLGDGRNDTTRYVYGTGRQADLAVQVRSPTGLVSLTGYDSITGNRTWQQTGTDASRRVWFSYDTRGHVSYVRSARALAAGEAGEEMQYLSPLGNLSAVVSPLGIRTTYAHDAIGRDTLVTTPADSARDLSATPTGALLYQTQRTTYDIAGRVLQTLTTSPATRYWGGDPRVQSQTVYDVPGQALTVTNTYDERHDLVAVTRASTPDSAKTGPITTRWKFDALGRTVAEIAPDPADSAITVAAHDAGFSRTLRDSTVYDPAGNVLRVLSRRGKWTRMEYDALNRLTSRTTDSVSYPVAVDTVLVPGTVSQRDLWYFPLFSPGPDGTPSDTLYRQPVVLRGDTAVFVYDAVGNILQADNADAKVHRTYYPNGLLQRDSLYLRNYAGTSFGHAYGITHTYDHEGRLVRDDRPAQLAAKDPTWAQSAYGYDPVTGALHTVSEASGGITGVPIATFSYDTDGRLTETDVGSSVETEGYDADGRSRWEKRVTGGVLAQLDSFTYDVRGKRTRVRSLADSSANAYSGMGALVWSWSKKYNQTNATEEAYAPDALANNYATTQVFHSDTSDFARYERSRPLYQKGTGRLLREDRWDRTLYTDAPDNQTASLYDAGGNRTWYMQKHAFTYHVLSDNSWLVERTHSYYGADEKLRVMDRRTCVIGQVATGQSWWAGTGARTDCVPPEWTDRPTWEEYRYDALGRRVLVRTNQTGWACESRCVNGVTRTLWDGDQILAEIRAPIDVAEQDTGRVPVGTAFDHGYGQVLYTHGPSLDHPLQVTRLSYDSVFPNPVWITPHTNWQGSYDSGEITNSDNSGTCHRISSGWYDNTPAATETYGTSINGTGYTHPDSVTVCVDLDWPAPYEWKSMNERGRGIVGPAAWMGSLIEGGRDLTGQMYMRNRYYDPTTGRFTQEDPTGLAGGLNLYGFAAGDPVTYSDPSGLKVCVKDRTLREYVEAGVNAFISWGADGCVSDSKTQVRFRGGSEWAENQSIFAQMVDARQTYYVDWGEDEWGHSWFNDTYNVANIRRGDITTEFSPSSSQGFLAHLLGWDQPVPENGAYYVVCWTSQLAPMTGPALVVHELLGHGSGTLRPYPAGRYAYRGHPIPGPAIDTENRYHRAVHEPTRCSQ